MPWRGKSYFAQQFVAIAKPRVTKADPFIFGLWVMIFVSSGMLCGHPVLTASVSPSAEGGSRGFPLLLLVLVPVYACVCP